MPARLSGALPCASTCAAAAACSRAARTARLPGPQSAPRLLTGPAVLALHRTTIPGLYATPKSWRLRHATSLVPQLLLGFA
jgi:hypothetical protein